MELQSFDNLNRRDAGASGIGQMLVLGIVVTSFVCAITPPPIPSNVWLMFFVSPLLFLAIGYLFYLTSGAWRNRGAFIRLHRGTRKLYYVAPRKRYLSALDWDQLVALAGYVPIVSQGGFTTRYPLYLVGLDADTQPPAEVCVACGNLGWRDEGQSASQLWDYLQRFMDDGPSHLTPPPPLPPRGTRRQAFSRLFSEWAGGVREKWASPSAKPWAPLWILGKLFWLATMTFPDSLAEWIQYNVPYTPFPKDIDELCGMSSPQVGDDT